jgi:hypothetical protein
MSVKQTTLFPPAFRDSKLAPTEQRYLFTLQRQLPLVEIDTSGGNVVIALPPAGLNSTTGESNQNQEIIYVKTSADANTVTINGALSGTVVLTMQYEAARFKSNATSWIESCCGTSGGGGAVASVFGRMGAVLAQAGDYSFSQISGPFDIGTF